MPRTPLDPTATRQADDVFYCANHDEPSLFDSAGNRVPLTGAPAQRPLRDKWLEIYDDVLAHNRDGSRPFPDCGFGHDHHGAASCAHCAAPQNDAPKTDPQPKPVDPADHDPVDPCEDCPAKKEPEKIRIRVSMFFDGTGNNKTNTALGSSKGSGSYENWYSNVALTEMIGLDPVKHPEYGGAIYIDGIGTYAAAKDSTYAQATGKDAAWTKTADGSGVIARVSQGLDQAFAYVKRIADRNKGKDIEWVRLDAVGFSRGAAAARHFCHKAMIQADTKLLDRFKAAGLPVATVEFKFLGLYDTVASHGTNHDDDTAELNLDCCATPEKTVQLAAAEEHRKNFRLTDIRSAGGKGLEIFLPGVHSDIGGGYAKTSNDDGIELYDLDVAWCGAAEKAALKRDRDWWIDSGWFAASEITQPNFFNEIHGTRTGIKNSYQFIPLLLMVEEGRRLGLAVKASGTTVRYPVPGDLKTVEAEIRAAIAAGLCSTPAAWFRYPGTAAPNWHKKLRRSHLHISAKYGTIAYAMQPQWLPASKDDPVSGARGRRINRG